MSDQENSVWICGVGARTPLGLNASSSAAAVRASIGALREHPYCLDKAGEPMSVAKDPILSLDLNGAERIHALALPAIKEALTPLGTLQNVERPIPAFIGLPEPRPGRPENLEGELARRLHEETLSSSLRITMISKGHSSGLMALEEAWKVVKAGKAEFCLAGGVDSYLEPETLEWLDQEQQLLSGQNRSGFPPGEAAGFCLITSSTAARFHKLEEDLGSIVSIATAMEENRIKTDDICIGKGLTEAISQVTRALNLPAEKIDFTYCDLNGERYRSEEFSFALLRTQAAFVNAIDNSTPADCWGDVGAASGPLFAILAVASGLRGYAKGPRSLLWTSSEGGQRSAAIIQLTTDAKGGI